MGAEYTKNFLVPSLTPICTLPAGVVPSDLKIWPPNTSLIVEREVELVGPWQIMQDMVAGVAV